MELDATQILEPVPAGIRLVLTITEAFELLDISSRSATSLPTAGSAGSSSRGRSLLAVVGISPVTK